MKNLRRFEFWIAACLLVLFSSGIVRACESPKQEYRGLVESLFQKAASIRIQGYYNEHVLDSEIKDKELQNKLKTFFLDEKPAFAGLFDQKTWGLSSYANNLSITWLDKNKKEIDTINLIDGDTLIFKDSRSVYQIPKVNNATNVTLLVCTVSLAKPEVFNPKSGK